MSRYRALLEDLRNRFEEISPAEALRRQTQGARLIDVRDPEETAQGSPSGATLLPRGRIETSAETEAPDLSQPLVLLCAAGERSLLAAQTLHGLGYTNLASVAGGFGAWRESGLPVETPRGLAPQQQERYRRHLAIPEVGEAGQLRLLESHAVLIGGGGLGSPAALYLAAAGVGTLTLIDDDTVDRSNLQRQVLYREPDIGRAKAAAARATLSALNPDITITAIQERLTADNVQSHLRGADVVLDGTDNFTTRYLINDACIALGLPNVHAAIFRFEGQVSVYDPANGAPCYRCAFPEAPPPELAPSCAQAGVLGVLPGVIGTLQATEALKLLLGIGAPLRGRMLAFDALEGRFRSYKQSRDPECPSCGQQTS